MHLAATLAALCHGLLAQAIAPPVRGPLPDREGATFLAASHASEHSSHLVNEAAAQLARAESSATTFSGDLVGVLFSAFKDEDIVHISFVIRGKRLDIQANCTEGSVTVDSHDCELSAFDLERLGNLDTLFTAADDPREDFCSPQRLVRRSAAYFARAPVGLKVARQTHSTRIVCLKPHTLATALWTDSQGGHSEELMVGDRERKGYGCMGRCGAGCLSKQLPLVQRWTQDCLNHDMCSFVNNSTFGALDRDCGDEFLAASDDYLFAVKCAYKP